MGRLKKKALEVDTDDEAPAPKPKKKSAATRSGKNVRLEYDTPAAAAQGCRVRKYTDGTKELVPKE